MHTVQWFRRYLPDKGQTDRQLDSNIHPPPPPPPKLKGGGGGGGGEKNKKPNHMSHIPAATAVSPSSSPSPSLLSPSPTLGGGESVIGMNPSHDTFTFSHWVLVAPTAANTIASVKCLSILRSG